MNILLTCDYQPRLNEFWWSTNGSLIACADGIKHIFNILPEPNKKIALTITEEPRNGYAIYFKKTTYDDIRWSWQNMETPSMSEAVRNFAKKLTYDGLNPKWFYLTADSEKT